MTTKFNPGDVVNIIDPLKKAVVTEAVIAYEFDPMKCVLHEDASHPDHVEWANVLGLDGSWYMHVPECHMELSEFGRNLHERE